MLVVGNGATKSMSWAPGLGHLRALANGKFRTIRRAQRDATDAQFQLQAPI